MIWQDMSEQDKKQLLDKYNDVKHRIKKLNSEKANKQKTHIFTDKETEEYDNKIKELQNEYDNLDVQYRCDMCYTVIQLPLDKIKQLLKSSDKPIFCSKTCSGKYYAIKSHKNKTKEQELERNKKISETLKNRENELTNEQKKQRLDNLNNYWSNFTSDQRSEINKQSAIKTKETKLEKYGDQNYNNREQAKQTNIEKYGVENTYRTDKAINKAKQVMQERYNTDYFFSNRDSFEKVSLERYNQIHPMKNKSIKLKLKQTKLEKYGDENYNNREKAKQTCLKKYGTTNSFNYKKTKYTKMARYNDPNYNNREQAMKTLFERYGEDYYEKQSKYIGSRISKINKQFAEFAGIKDFEFPINKCSYDLKKDNILIEIDPSFTHNCLEEPIYHKFGNIDKLYHYNKSILAKENGYRCIHIFDWDDWNKILYMIQDKETLYARNLEIKEVDLETCDDFLYQYHIQSTCKGQEVRLGLFKDNELMEIMTFGKPRYNKNYGYELLRLCTHKDYKVVGGSERLFKHFINTYKPSSIISYCDFSKFNGEVYVRLGFKQKGKTNPSKHWSKGNKHITDNLLRQRGFDQLFKTNYGKGTSNEQLMIEHNWLPIYDAGQITFIWLKEEE